MNKRVFWSIADSKNKPYFEMMKNSFLKSNPNEEMILFGEDEVRATNDPQIFYRATPYFSRFLFDRGYTEICKIDADTIIFDNLSEAFEGDFDVAVVNNSNPREVKSYPYQFLNLNPLAYVNCGFVVLKSRAFADWWWNWCNGVVFNACQMKEQDGLNLMVFSNNYKIKRLDEGDSFWGLADKQYEPDIIIKDGKPFLPKGDEWPDRDKWIKAWHSAGGQNDPAKMNYRIKFQEPVVELIDKLVKPEGINISEEVKKT